VISAADERLLESHRATWPSSSAICAASRRSRTAEPEEVMEVLREYHAALGEIIHRFEGTLERFLGDGLMVLFNDPIPCPDPAVRASKWPSRCAIV